MSLMVAASLFGVLFLSACDSGGDNSSFVTTGVYVANQGNFSDANGSITVYDPVGKTSQQLVADAGSTVQSIMLSGDIIYMMSNTGGRIDVYDRSSGSQVDQIDGLASPRYMAVSDVQIGYVTNLFKTGFTGGSVSVVDLVSGSVTSTVDVGDNPEGVAISGGQVFVANSAFGEGTTLSTISLSNNLVTGTIDVGCDGPRLLFGDREDELWVVCTGKTVFDANSNIVEQTDGEIVILDGPTGAVVTRIPIAGQVSTVGPGQDAFYSEGAQELYVVVDSERILRFNTGSNGLAENLGVFAGDEIGAVAYDSRSKQIYVARVPSFTAAGYVTVHDRSGQQLEQFPTGIAPSHIAFAVEEQ